MDNNLIKVEGDQFVKNKNNGALLAVNKNILIQNEARKKLGKKLSGNDNEINTLKNKIEEMSTDLVEIKSILSQLIQKRTDS
jgi:chaperonin cofactor prefoldin